MSKPARRSRPWATRSCRDCMGWGWIDRPRCKACWGSVAKATSQHCDVCQREVAAIDGVCRLCRRQACLIAGPDNKTRVDLTVAARTGQQLFIIGTLRPRHGLPPRANAQRPQPEPLRGQLHGVQPQWTEPSLFEMQRDLRGVSSLAPLLDPELATSLSTRAARIAELRGWPPRTLGAEGHQVSLRGSPAGRDDPGLDDHPAHPHRDAGQSRPGGVRGLGDLPRRPSGLTRCLVRDTLRLSCTGHSGGAGYLDQYPAARDLSPQTTGQGSILPFLTEYAAKYTTLRQVTRDDVIQWLAATVSRFRSTVAGKSDVNTPSATAAGDRWTRPCGEHVHHD